MARYQHTFLDDIDCTTELSKIVCVGRNYAEHAKELNNPIPTHPLIFIKPSTAAVSMHEPVPLPTSQGSCHHELEMAILISTPLTCATSETAAVAIAGIGLALDLTLRDVQNTLKAGGQPWERAKAFDGSCPLSKFITTDGVDLQDLSLQLYLNDELQQSGNTADMLFPVTALLAEISQSFTLLPGDVVLTGTPAGVGPLRSGDKFRACLGSILEVEGVAA